jgi:hypothetical protein
VVESVFSQYCGHSSAAGVTCYLKFCEPILVDPVDCTAAKDNGGNLTINGKVFNAQIGSRTFHSFFVAGSLDSRHNCQTGTVVYGNNVIDYQSTQSVLEISLMEEFAKANDMTGMIKLPRNVQAKAKEQGVMDSLLGTLVWRHKQASCPQGLTQLFCGKIQIFLNKSFSFVGAIALLEEKGQVAGLELLSLHLLCHHPAYATHLRDVVLVVHPDNITSIATDPFDPEQITDYIRLETELSFLHVKTTISNRDWLRQVRLAIYKTRRQVAATRLEAAAGSENLYAFVEVFGRGHMSTRARAAVYSISRVAVSMQPRAVMNCTSEVPVSFNGTDMFVDPISYVLRTHAVQI